MLPVFTSMFQVRVQVFEHVEQPGYQAILASHLDGPAVDQNGNPTPVIRLHWRGAHFVPVDSDEPVLELPTREPLGDGPVAVVVAWQAQRTFSQILEDVNGPLAGVDPELEDQARQTADAGRTIAVNITPQSGESETQLLLDHVTRLQTLRDRLEEMAGASSTAGEGPQPRLRHRPPRGDRGSSTNAVAGAIRRRDWAPCGWMTPSAGSASKSTPIWWGTRRQPAWRRRTPGGR